MITIRTSGASEFQAYLRQAAEIVARDVESLATQSARVLGVELARGVLPIGFAEPESLRWEIARGIRSIFPTREGLSSGDPVATANAYELIARTRGKEVADKFWAAFKDVQKSGGSYEKIANMASRLGLPRRIDRAAHDAARTEKPWARIPWSAQAVAMVNPQSLSLFVAKQQRKAGLAQSGWIAASLSLGGRIRYRRLDDRSTGEKVPKHLRLLARRYRHLGWSRMSVRRGKVAVTLTNSVAHIQTATKSDLQAGAIRKAQEHFVKAVSFAINWQLRKGNFRRAGAAPFGSGGLRGMAAKAA